jgi:phenylalanyl-tRNA synthetase beta chain
MKVTLNWLKQYTDFAWSPAELAERLTMLGLEVEGVHRIGGEFEGVVVAQVLSREKHPNADKLSVCRVQDGQGERQIVCGAQNFQAGDKVPLVLPGHTLPGGPGAEPLTIKVGKIRGVESHGMMCSGRELGLSEDADGLWILDAGAPVGRPFAEYLNRSVSDVLFDLEVTPNRPDLNSVLGIARELSALTGNPLRLPAVGDSAPNQVAASGSLEDWAGVRIEDPELCPRYTARIIRGVTIGPSPDWLRRMIENVGLRSINNVVDVTNYVMLETGQPLHAFDLSLLGIAAGQTQPTIVVRRARSGERFTTLDGQDRLLDDTMLLIADETRAVALAGIMGGQNSEIRESTREVLLESACFKPSNIRFTSKRLGLKTDASYRFERGADIGCTAWASQRAADLIAQTAQGTVLPGVIDAFPGQSAPRRITLRHAKVKALLGVDIPSDEQQRYLQRLALELELESEAAAADAGSVEDRSTFRIPTFRVDLKRETDLIEEIARLYGVDKIPSTPPRGAIGSHANDAIHDQLAEMRRILTGLGLSEAQGQTLIAQRAATLGQTLLGTDAVVSLSNPLSSDMNVLRPSLLPGLLDSLRHNVNHKSLDLALFEIGRVFNHAEAAPREERRVGLALTGLRYAPFWTGAEREARCDLHDLKGVIEGFLDQFGLRGAQYVRQTRADPLFLECACVVLGKQTLGMLGQMQPLLARQYDLRDPVMLAEFSADLLLARRSPARGFKSLPAFPAIRRDLALMVPESTTHEAVVNTVRQLKPPHLESVELFDVFRGKTVVAGQKSMAYAFLYRHAERTLTDDEVNQAQEKLTAELTRRLSATIRM